MLSTSEKTIEDRVAGILLEYASNTPPSGPLNSSLTLRNDLGIESLSLVSVVLRLGEECGVEMMDSSLEIRTLETVGDLISLGHSLKTVN